MANLTLQDCAHILGVSYQSDAQVIKTAYRKLAKKLHPDVNPSPRAAQEFDRVQKAYDTIMLWKEKGVMPLRSYKSSVSAQPRSRATHKPPPTRRYDDVKRRARAKQFQQIKKEQKRKAQKAFKESFFYPLYQLLKFLLYMLLIISAFLSFFIPIIIQLKASTIKVTPFIIGWPLAVIAIGGALKMRKYVKIPFIRG